MYLLLKMEIFHCRDSFRGGNCLILMVELNVDIMVAAQTPFFWWLFSWLWAISLSSGVRLLTSGQPLESSGDVMPSWQGVFPKICVTFVSNFLN